MPSDPTLIESGGTPPDRPRSDTPIEKTLIEARNEGGADERTLLAPTPGGGIGLNLVPGAQFLEYHLVEPIKVASGEAELWVADGGGRRVVLKFYRWGLHPKAELSEKLSRISKAQIVEVYGRGTSPDGRDYEILEFIRHGTLADFGKGGLPETKVREVLRELTDAVAALHEENILHRDLKPANVLVRTIEPLDLVLTDFGISSVMDISLHVTSVSRTAAYSAPEAMTGVVSKASDWWSVGVMIMELHQGAQPFAGLDERAVNFALVMRGIAVPKEVPTAWQSLLKGLLTRDHAKRWNEVQIRQWLEGKKNIPVYYNEATAIPAVRIKQKYRPCQFLKTEYFEPSELALAMAEHWDDAVKRFERGIITEWIKKEVQNADLASLLMDIQEDLNLTADQKLSVALLAMNDQMPLSWRGEVVNQEWMATHPGIAIGFLKSDLSSWWKRIHQETWLEELKARYLELRRKINKACDDETVFKAALATDAALLEYGRKAQQDYYSSTDAQINELLSKEQLTPLEGAILALTSPTRFVRRQEVAQQHATDFITKIKTWGKIRFPTTRSTLAERVTHLRGAAKQLEEELKKIMGIGPVPAELMNAARKVINNVQDGLESLLTERKNVEKEILNDLPRQLAANPQFVKTRLSQIGERFSDIDLLIERSQIKGSLGQVERTNAEAMILNELPRQLGAGQLLTTKQELQQIKSRFPGIDCGELEKAINEWEAFYQSPCTEVGRFETDLRGFAINANASILNNRIGTIPESTNLDERLSLLRTDIAQRQQILNEKYQGTEFYKVAAPVMASLSDRLPQLELQLQQIKERIKVQGKHQRKKRIDNIATGVFWLLMGGCGLAVGIWMLSAGDAIGITMGIIFLTAGAIGIIAGLCYLKEVRFCWNSIYYYTVGFWELTGVVAAAFGICFLIIGVWGLYSGSKPYITICSLAAAFYMFDQAYKTRSGKKLDILKTIYICGGAAVLMVLALLLRAHLQPQHRKGKAPVASQIASAVQSPAAELKSEGSLRITSDPPGAKIYQGHVFLASTPWEFKGLPAKTTSFSLIKTPGYKLKTLAGKILPGKTADWAATLEPVGKSSFIFNFPVPKEWESIFGMHLAIVITNGIPDINTGSAASPDQQTSFRGFCEMTLVAPGSLAEKAGWADGATIGTVLVNNRNGKDNISIEFENSEFKALFANTGISILNVRDGGILSTAGLEPGESFEGLNVSSNGEVVLTMFPVPLVISDVQSPQAIAAGARSGDKIVAINGLHLSSWHQFVSIVTNSPITALRFDALRGNKAVSFEITPRLDTNGIPRVGLVGSNRFVRIPLLNSE